MKEKVLVGISGGVDSAVCALKLIEDGYEVHAATLVMFGSLDEDPVAANIKDAKAVAAQLGIPHDIIEVQDLFTSTVIDYFANLYSRGLTPNPCVVCNPGVKLDTLIKVANEKRIDKIATGHYAVVKYDDATGRYIVCKGVDGLKDQSYFLYRVGQNQLSRLLCPLSGSTKNEIRDLAIERDLKVAQKYDSQEICFVAGEAYSEFLQTYLNKEFKPGPIIDREGNVLGEHKGIIYYTVGQRHGMGVSAPEPLYVLEIKPDDNTIVAGYEHELARTELELADCHYMATDSLDSPRRFNIKIRYRAREQSAMVSRIREGLMVKFDEPVSGVAPGQAAVIYDGDCLIGGGTII